MPSLRQRDIQLRLRMVGARRYRLSRVPSGGRAGKEGGLSKKKYHLEIAIVIAVALIFLAFAFHGC